MKKFVLKTLFISLPILLSLFILEILLRNIPNDYEFKRDYLDHHASEIETLIWGSSHSFYGINPDYFTGHAFNASHISQSLNYDYEIFEKYQDNFRNLKTIIIPISYFTLFGNMEAGSEPWRVKNYMIYYRLNSSSTLTNYSEVLSNRINVNTRRLVSFYVRGKSTISCSRLGWGTRFDSKEASELIESGKISAMRHTRDDIQSDKFQDIFNENILILNSIMQWSNANNVNVLLLTLPAYETYRQYLNSEQLTTSIETTTELCSRYDNCLYDNMLSDSRFVAEDFHDADHLSVIGAQKLSIFLNDRIIEWN